MGKYWYNWVFLTLLVLVGGCSLNALAQGDRTIAPPTDITASIQFNTVGGESKPFVHITWKFTPPVKQCLIERDGATIVNMTRATAYDDTAVLQGQTYSYTLKSIMGAKISKASPPVTITIPSLGAFGPAPIPPSNLRVTPIWASGQTDKLTWDATNAIKYRIYQYDRLIAETTNTTYTLPISVWQAGVVYTVTSIRGDGKESIPSNICQAIGGPNPNSRPAWTPAAPGTPFSLVVVPEWNNGAARNVLSWRSNRENWWHNIYRDGVLIATGITQLFYVDKAIQPGRTYSYRVSGLNYDWTNLRESAQSAALSATSLSTATNIGAITPVNITSIVPNDDSALLVFQAVPGAKDYRAYTPNKPGIYKYSGGSLSVEVNGLTPGVSTPFFVEALDKLGPYQKIDGELGPGGMHEDGSIVEHINGQGDPTSVPLVIGKSASITVTPVARTLTGANAFFDTFRDFKPLVQMPMDQRIVSQHGGRWDDPNNPFIREWQNDKWLIRNYMGDQNMSRNFVMSNHFMETLYDGGTSFVLWPIHNNDSTLVMSPKATADMSGGKVLHVTFEVDPHFSGRRWIDVIVADSAEPLLKPNDVFFQTLPVPSGRIFRWDQFPERALVITGTGQAGGNKMSQATVVVEGGNGFPRRMGWDGNPFLNGTMGDLDKRHRFDLYLSQTRFRIIEQGVTLADGPLAAPLSFPLNRVAVYFLHQVYHTSLEHADLITWAPSETFWINHRPWADERHWDNMGFEVLDKFP